jgi:hypothetical protein
MQKQLLKMNLPEKQGIGRFYFVAALCLSLVFTLFGVQAIQAQNRKTKKRIVKKPNPVIAKNNQLQNDKLNVNLMPVMPVAVVNSAETDFLSGEASVLVNPKQPTVVRLGLAQNAVSIVEFPASDGIYYIHEGNPKMVSVFQSPTKESDRSITIYPGEGFVSGRADSGTNPPSATITLQMRSGLVLVLEFVPVSALSKNAHRCVINYNRDEVISARRTAGLAFNLGEEATGAKQKNTKANSKLVGAGGSFETTDADSKDENDSGNVQIARASLQIERGVFSRKVDEKSTKQPKSGLELSRLVNRRLADCLKNPKKNLGAWSKANLGLSLAISPVSEVDAEQRLLVVAVRNEAAANLRLVPGTPELQIQTVDGQGNALVVERIERIYVETTSFEGTISPGSTAYYAIVYRAPVMGASQRLMVLASHREAADTPSTITLPTVNDRAKE